MEFAKSLATGSVVLLFIHEHTSALWELACATSGLLFKTVKERLDWSSVNSGLTSQSIIVISTLPLFVGIECFFIQRLLSRVVAIVFDDPLLKPVTVTQVRSVVNGLCTHIEPRVISLQDLSLIPYPFDKPVTQVLLGTNDKRVAFYRVLTPSMIPDDTRNYAMVEQILVDCGPNRSDTVPKEMLPVVSAECVTGSGFSLVLLRTPSDALLNAICSAFKGSDIQADYMFRQKKCNKGRDGFRVLILCDDDAMPEFSHDRGPAKVVVVNQPTSPANLSRVLKVLDGTSRRIPVIFITRADQ